MKIAELFIQLGVKGADKAAGALSGMRGTLKDVTSTSLEAKAAIIGVMYGLERLMSASGQMGTNLTQFNNLTGLSADNLQRWQYLALKSGESADEMAGSIQGVQNAMTKMLLGQGAPTGITALANTIGFDTSRARDTFYVMDKLREYAQRTKNIPDVANEILKSFGLSDKTIQALRTSTVDLTKVDPSHMYTSAQRAKLNDVNIGWTMLGDKIEHSFGKLNAKFGPKLISDISRLADQVLRMVDAFAALAEKLQVIQVIGESFKGWTEIFSTVTQMVNDVNGTSKKHNVNSLLPSADSLKLFLKDMIGQGAPKPEFAKHGAAAHINNVNVNNHVTIHGVTNPDEVPKHLNKMINDAYRQIPRGGQ